MEQHAWCRSVKFPMCEKTSCRRKGMGRMSRRQWYSGAGGIRCSVSGCYEKGSWIMLVCVLMPENIHICFVLMWCLTVAVKFRFFISVVSGCCTTEKKRNFLCTFSGEISSVNTRDASHLDIVPNIEIQHDKSQSYHDRAKNGRSCSAYASLCVANDFH